MNISNFHIYGYSFLVISWMIGTLHLQNVKLRSLDDSLKDINAKFGHISLTHVYRELNTMVDKFLKEGLDVQEGQIILTKFINGFEDEHREINVMLNRNSMETHLFGGFV